jgi:chromosome transmission fidelity protein 4
MMMTTTTTTRLCRSTTSAFLRLSSSSSMSSYQVLMPHLHSDLQGVPMQEPFQSSSTPLNANASRRFLVWNMVGVVTVREEFSANTVDIEFHDAAESRPVHITDHHGITMAALSAEAAVLAAPSTPGADDKSATPSTIMYKKFNPWAPNSDWSFQLDPKENVTAVAVGRKWAAASTDKDMLRIFTLGGLQICT